jgi:hypothetical protein
LNVACEIADAPSAKEGGELAFSTHPSRWSMSHVAPIQSRGPRFHVSVDALSCRDKPHSRLQPTRRSTLATVAASHLPPPTFSRWPPVQAKLATVWDCWQACPAADTFANSVGTRRSQPSAENAELSVIETHVSRGFFMERVTNRTRYAVDVTGGGRNSVISRRMSAKRFLGMATSAIWKAT